MATNDEILRELGEQRQLLQDLHARPSIGMLASKMIDRLIKPRIIASFALLLGAVAIVGGKIVRIEAFGFLISSEDQNASSDLSKTTEDHASLELGIPASDDDTAE